MPGFLPRRPTCFSDPAEIRRYYEENPNVVHYLDDYVDTAGDPFINWAGTAGPSWGSADPNYERWNMIFEGNSEVFTDYGTHSVWGSDAPSLETADDWGDADWAPDFSADFDETGWPHGTFNWDNPRPFTFFWPPTLQIDADTRRSLLLWHAAMDWASRDILPPDLLEDEPVINQDA